MHFDEYYLKEEAQAMYHATNIDVLYNILKDNSIKFTLSMGADAKINKNKYYYLSTMRVKYGNYASIGLNGLGYKVIINLNSSTIGHVAKIKSVEYWGKDFRSLAGNKDEQEERIMIDKPELSPLSKYVNEIHVYIGKLEDKSIVSKLIELANKDNVKIYFYDKGNETAFKMQRKEKSIKDFSNLNSEPKVNEFEYNVVYKAKDGSKYVDVGNYSLETAKSIVDESPNAVRVIHKDDIEKQNLKLLSLSERRLIDLLNVYNNVPTIYEDEYKIVDRFKYDEGLIVLQSMIKNLKTSHSIVLNLIVNNMKKVGIRKLDDFLKLVQSKIQNRKIK